MVVTEYRASSGTETAHRVLRVPTHVTYRTSGADVVLTPPTAGLMLTTFPPDVMVGPTRTVDLEAEFRGLSDQWHRETGHLSSPEDIALHPAYLKIIGKGASVVPFILEDLRSRGGQWYIALDAITRASPLPLSTTPALQDFKNAWLQWGRDRHLIN